MEISGKSCAWLVTWLFVLFSSAALAKSYSISVGEAASEPAAMLPVEPHIVVTGTSEHRICLYEGKPYSLGAYLPLGEFTLECVPENDVETNGRLRWQRVESPK
uniref:DUF1496 domain-containing protein n=1 Tax=Thaumasiovibrio occultus TaxID=1891184 RepID=UPI000B353820|nr:DUF1496 domain-containing protein [Thaumasiovibrio occultus]